MSFIEVYQEPGSFRLPMKTNTPHLKSAIQEGGYLIVTPVYLGDPRNYTLANLTAAARYVGIVTKPRWRNGELTLEGAGLDWIFGNKYGVGWPAPSVGFIGATLDTVIAAESGGGLIPTPQFTIGTVTNTGSTHSATWDSTSTLAQALKTGMADCAAHYKFSGLNTIDAESVDSNNLYRADPIVVATRNYGGDDALYNGLEIIDIESSTSIEEWLSTSGNSIRGLGDDFLERVDTATTDPTQAKLGGITEYTTIKTSSRYVKGAGKGDTIYVYDPGSGFSSLDLVWFRGQALAPATHRIHEHEWQATKGQGYYYLPPKASQAAADVVDLTATVDTVATADATTYLRSYDVDLLTGGCS